MSILACDPGLGATGLVLLAEDGKTLLDHDSRSFRKGAREERSRQYVRFLEAFVLRQEPRPEVFVIEEQGASWAAPDATGGLTGGRALPADLQRALEQTASGARSLVGEFGISKRQRVLSRERGGKNRDIMATAHLAGTLANRAYELGLRVIWVSPQAGKAALCSGDRMATKSQMIARARIITGVDLDETCSDALGIGGAGWRVLREEALRARPA